MIKQYFLTPVTLLIPYLAFAQTTVSGRINENTIWTESASPYLVTSNITLGDSATLTIEPGVVVKMGFRNTINVNGTLLAVGTATQPIVFTSVKDDEYGGDTDGANGAPQPGEWSSIRLRSASRNSVLGHVIVRYGGYFNTAAVQVESTEASFANCAFQSNRVGLRKLGITSLRISNTLFCSSQQAGIEVQEGIVSVDSCSFLRNNKFAIENLSTSNVVASNNWWDADIYIY